MKISLAENIAKYRKANAMTQERLAEALGVTCASVSKWERAATPELTLIARMAGLFGVSLDALVGYEFANHGRASVVARLREYAGERDASDRLDDVENALARYPNDFEVVYWSAHCYHALRIMRENEAWARRALELLRHARGLIGQNPDPRISEASISADMAAMHRALGEYDEGLALLKENNPCRVHEAAIGYVLAVNCGRVREALPHLSCALWDMTVALMNIAARYVNAYVGIGGRAEALAVLDWALACFPGLRRPGVHSYLEKAESVLWTARAA